MSTSVNLKDVQNCNWMNAKDLSKMTILKKVKLWNTAGSLSQLWLEPKESRWMGKPFDSLDYQRICKFFEES